MTFGKRLQDFRKQKGYSRADIASMLNVSNAIVEKWELDQRRPPLHRAEKLAGLYGVTVNDLIGDSLLNDDQKLKAIEVARILESGNEKEKDRIRVHFRSAGFSEQRINDFFDMAVVMFKPPCK